jgi:hypothetical protein
MKTIAIFILSSIFIKLYAPPSGPLPTKEQSFQFQIITNPLYRAYYPLIKAVVYVESRGNDSALNVKEGAKGQYQIREVRISEFNRLTGKNYSHDEMYEYYKATEVFMYYLKDRDYETIARAWCSGESGTRKASQNYWNLVNNRLISQL